MRKLLPLLLTVLLLPMGVSHAQTSPTAIFDYVNAPDPSYCWEKVGETQLANGCTQVTLNLTSQTWQGLKWTHQLLIIRPAQMTTPEVGVLFINGGKLGNAETGMVGMLANAAGGPVVYLGDIPNQPLFGNLHEDALIAHTFTQYLKTKDPTWPLLFPMTKAAVRAMDAVQEYTTKEWARPVSKFVVTGASKRGWTTWFTGEADPKRVVGIAPIVYDNLNLPAQMALQKSSYGVYTSQIDDYTALGLPDLLQTPAGKEFGALVDPYTYRDRATMPKLMINGSNDPYWVIDSANIYFGDLVGPRYLTYLPNTGHGNGDLMRLIAAEIGFYQCCAGQAPFPQFNWQYQEDPTVVKLGMVSDIQPARVLQWTATSPTRDFRKAKWECCQLELAGGQYLAQMKKPAQGYAAMFGEALYTLNGREIPTSTTIRVVGGQ
ncbi:MAG: PhoPQ-activated protein PqaA family protein [Armatimonadia bacterium]